MMRIICTLASSLHSRHSTDHISVHHPTPMRTVNSLATESKSESHEWHKIPIFVISLSSLSIYFCASHASFPGSKPRSYLRASTYNLRALLISDTTVLYLGSLRWQLCHQHPSFYLNCNLGKHYAHPQVQLWVISEWPYRWAADSR